MSLRKQNRVQQWLPRFLSLISIAQGETGTISFVQAANLGYFEKF